ncbi:helix-turn-helix domain-containing protein [Pseudobacteriovorax antillogorgiicola]|uniref:Helix-turn-helix n=1 Tax=Pseudobacteriovorax antillogorgiicola TaxID=1513793 RepID=A0A1Y6CFJ3_9BACT|nr:helix-turn-helix transcriptional regulator [Pseudobacteriovorax antillogorgiicola]TCS51741.1 helix-turn-helix protein [Pseudobacteriovorax antillogorgiicola]SMF49641.1 Helix-turn-helix [Pseudobacteriovorax antillogorgiicola]
MDSFLSDNMVAEIQTIYDEYLLRYKCKSAFSQIAKRANVSRSTVTRFIQGEAKPQFENLVAIMAVMLNKSDLAAFIEKHFPEMGSILKSTYQPDSDGSVHLNSDSLTRHLTTEVGDLIYNLASTNEGTTRKQIERLRGLAGLDSVDELLEEDHLQIDTDGRISNKEKEFALWDSKTVMRGISFDLDRFDSGLLGTSGAAIVRHTESLNMEGLSEVKKAIYRASQEISRIKHDPRYQGNIPFYVSAVFNLFDKENFGDDEVKK